MYVVIRSAQRSPTSGQTTLTKGHGCPYRGDKRPEHEAVRVRSPPAGLSREDQAKSVCVCGSQGSSEAAPSRSPASRVRKSVAKLSLVARACVDDGVVRADIYAMDKVG